MITVAGLGGLWEGTAACGAAGSVQRVASVQSGSSNATNSFLVHPLHGISFHLHACKCIKAKRY
jgi:hypothetical protein